MVEPGRNFALVRRISVIAAASWFLANAQPEPQVSEPEAMVRMGNYDQARSFIQSGGVKRNERARYAALEVRVLLTLGNYEEALNRAGGIWRRDPVDYPLCLEYAGALTTTGQPAIAHQVLELLAQNPPVEGVTAQVGYGEVLLALKQDPKQVLQEYLEPAKAADANNRAVYLAIGRLGLANHDRDLAAENFREGLKRFPGDEDFLLGLAEAGVPTGEAPPSRTEPPPNYADLVLRTNPRNPDALLFKSRKFSDAKQFEQARKTLNELFKVNPRHPEAWAEMAMIAYVLDDRKEATQALAKAREIWHENPRISEIIGTGLARHYRFAEGIEFLRDALKKDPESTSIRFELGSNLLRFGSIDEGWRLIEEVHQADPYHVAAFNLITLRDRLKNFPVLERDGVKVRMSPEDAAVFGERAADFALKAKQTLAAKYGVTLSQPVMVEILPTQEDFAIRTFGLPGGESFLGVCFGPLITMTSPRGRLGRNNWEAILWHEMAHTVTLEASRHRIPRWLTEGISVYEEGLAHAGWGQGMNSAFRQRFVAEDYPSIAKLDEAFATKDIGLAYYQSSRVVEHLVERFGIEKIRSVLADLAAGMPLAKSFEVQGFPLPELEKSFKTHITESAKSYGSKLDWMPLDDDEYREYREDPQTWSFANPDRYAASMLLITKFSKEGKWAEAKADLTRLIAAEPDNREESNPYQQLATACRNLGDRAGEQAAWKKLLDLDASSADAATGLLQLANESSPAERIAVSERLLAINPFSETAYRTLSIASREAGALPQTRNALSALLALQPSDASGVHYELAAMLRESEPGQARLHVLKALEENPRFQKGLDLLVLFPPRQ